VQPADDRVQPVQHPGAAAAPEPYKEPSREPSAADAPARQEPSADDGRLGAGPVGEFFTALGGAWRLTADQRARLASAVESALNIGWAPAEFAAFAGANTSGVRNPYAILAVRLNMYMIRRTAAGLRPPSLKQVRTTRGILARHTFATSRRRGSVLSGTIRTYSIRYMRSVREEERPREDLTARARIRDAALEQFGVHGFDAATIRGIAEAAGVSPGLVQHHFRSKEALRRACDEAVLDLVHRKLAATQTGEITNPSFLAALYSAAPRFVRYLARAVADGTPAGAELFDQIAAGTGEFLTTTWPDRFATGSTRTRDAAGVLVAQVAGTIVLHEHVARQMGLVAWDGLATPRIGLAQLDVYEALGEYVRSALGERAREVVAGLAKSRNSEGEHP
jgi:AcrR family transcriptional regulator